jgi:pilus assembly protein CpaF
MSDHQQLKQYLRAQLQRAALHAQANHASSSQTQLLQQATELLEVYVQAQGHPLDRELRQTIRDVVDDCIGLGPLTQLLADDSVSEIMVNNYQSIFVERSGCLQKTSIQFTDEEALLRVIDRIVLPLGRRLDSAQPMVDARLPDGSRVNAVLAALAPHGTCMTIRKFSVQQLSLDDLVTQRALVADAAQYLRLAVQQRRNILIVGGTGTGKTTLLNMLAAEVPTEQRIVTIEDAAELRLHHGNLISLEARPANAEGSGQVSIRELLINALRMRPDRIVIGECRGAEAIDMLQAMNTGHDGSLTTLHANSPREALQRLEVMVMMAGLELPFIAIRQLIASAIQLVVHIVRSHSGQRRIQQITEITGMDAGTIQHAAIFEWQQHQQQLLATGIPSEWVQR